eukprot:COSAG02_NODE_27010_length_619_cov_0.625000_1_plen_29_part_10
MRSAGGAGGRVLKCAVVLSVFNAAPSFCL